MRRVKLLGAALLAVVMLVTGSAPAAAQEWSQWFYHPNSENYWYCGYWDDQYWCYTEWGAWIRAVSPKLMQQVDGWQPV